MSTVHSFCRLCIAMCGVTLEVDHSRGEVLSARGAPDHPVSRGYLCPKGRSIGTHHGDPVRLSDPMLGRAPQRQVASPEAVLDDLGAAVAGVLEADGPAAVGIMTGIGSSFDSLATWMVPRFLRAVGTRNLYTTWTVDNIAKPAVYQMMGGPAVLWQTLDEQRCRLTLLIGSNVVVSHGHDTALPDPIRRLRDLRNQGEVWVVDPRSTETSRQATRHLPVRPGSDHVLLAHVVREILHEGADVDYLRAHARNVETLRTAVEPFDLAAVVEHCGVDAASVDALITAIRRAGRIGLLTGTGVTMARHPALAVWLGQALLAVTGSLEREGGVWFNPLFTYQDDLRPSARLGTQPAPGPPSRPELPSWAGQMPSVALVDEIESGNLRALLVLGANPTLSLPQPERLRSALAAIDVLAVCDIVTTDAVDVATHVLPGTSQLERPDVKTPAGPVVHGEYTPAVFAPPPGRRSTWWWLDQLALRLGHDLLGRHRQVTDEAELLAAVTHGRRSVAELAAHPHGIVSEDVAMGWVERNHLPDHRWDVAPAPLVAQLAQAQPVRPDGLRLIVRRQMRHANSVLSLTQPGPVRDEPGLYIHPDDANARGLRHGEPVRVTSEHGTLRTTTRHDATLSIGVAALPHGWQHDNVAALVSTAVDIDPITAMPVLTGVAITAQPA